MSYVCCPRCGLTVYQRHLEIALQYCPRCIAHARTPVLMETATTPSTDPSSPSLRRTRALGKPRLARARARSAATSGRPTT
jgi:hypothetical protein